MVDEVVLRGLRRRLASLLYTIDAAVGERARLESIGKKGSSTGIVSILAFVHESVETSWFSKNANIHVSMHVP